MSVLSLRLPDSLHRKIRELAERDDVSINQFLATAAAEKAAALLAVEYLEARAARGDAVLFDRLLARVPDVPPAAGDDLPGRLRPSGRAPLRVRRRQVKASGGKRAKPPRV
jgi:predicted transcriptional regulator